MSESSTTLTAEVIAIGDELISGARVDTNSQWLSIQLSDLGIRPLFHTTVGDDLDANVQAFRIAAQRADVVVATGGLGPTQDDLTRDALAEALHAPLELRSEVIEHLERLFARRDRPMPQRNRVQAMFPRGSRVIPNPHGSAPGIEIAVPAVGRPDTLLFALPGVPAEMKEMWKTTVAASLQARVPLARRRVIARRVLKCFGVGESDLEERIADLTQRGRVPSVGITASKATLSLRIESLAESAVDAERRVSETVAELYRRLGDLVFGEGEDYELPDAVLDILLARGESLCCIEVGHDGLIDQWLSERERPAAFRGCLSLTEQSQVLSWLAPEAPGDIGDEPLEHLLRCVATRFGSDWALAVCAYPTLASVSDPALQQSDTVSFVLYHASSGDFQREAKRVAGHPDILKTRTAKQALDFVRRALRAADARGATATSAQR